VSANDRRINQEVFKVAIFANMRKEFFKDAELTPSMKAFIDRVPVAVTFGEEPPLSHRFE
jgi:hypothetical protein